MKLLRYVATVVVMLIASPVLACTCSFGTPEMFEGKPHAFGLRREQQSGSAGSVTNSSPSEWSVVDPGSVTNSSPSEWSVGDPGSPVVLEVFNDYQCPPCGFFNVELKRIQVKYAGRVRVVYRNYPITNTHVNAMRAAQVAEAAGLQGKFFEMIDLLYQKRVSWAGSKNADKLFVSYARELKLNLKKFRADLKSEAVQQRIDRDVERARLLKVDGTPTIVINGELIPLERMQKLDSEIEAKLNAAKSASP
jgi:protein-disulfide isomerase